MNLVCPACGAQFSAEIMANDAEAREAMAAIAAMPAEIAHVILPYLALFRPAKRRLSWGKAKRLLEEIRELMASGKVGKGVDVRPCSPGRWAKAMAQMQDQKETIRRPLTSHAYLISVAYGLAEQAAAEEEMRAEAGKQGGFRPDGPNILNDGGSERISFRGKADLMIIVDVRQKTNRLDAEGVARAREWLERTWQEEALPPVVPQNKFAELRERMDEYLMENAHANPG